LWAEEYRVQVGNTDFNIDLLFYNAFPFRLRLWARLALANKDVFSRRPLREARAV
jgi:hypothetical protein